MKRIALLMVVALSLYSCSTEDDGPNVNFAVAEITDTDLPEFFEIGESYDLEVTYQLPNACHDFYTFDVNQYKDEENDSTFVIEIAALTSYDANLTECPEDGEISDSRTIRNLRIMSEDYNTYQFKLLTGIDENEEGEFLIIDVPIGEPEPATPEENTNE
ncbi:hypothetical protein DET49_11256 [Salegentibacter sp. 24]|jgi:hypothetical protein|uniref:hypothetical protein n=1 Tax=Salegentibacter sp. 24 TaxID=2183986 RepID=UPI00106006CF|nr:hypothetical protein [Salegentibacter sp. 24]TDN87366.1 hypothetical protein DET49_11256 [Salegentibacter sp. 24]